MSAFQGIALAASRRSPLSLIVERWAVRALPSCNTVHYLGIEIDDAIEIAEKIKI
jgi:hypothetical protein